MIAGTAARHGGPGNPGLVAFGLKFLGMFVLAFGGYEAARGSQVEEWLIRSAVLRPTVAIINVAGPTADVRVEGRNILSSASNLHVTRGCEGVEMLMLLGAGILTFPASAHRRLRGFLIGVVLVYGLTLTRLILLHFALRYNPGAWDALHGFVLPLAPVLLIALYFLRWTEPALPGPRPDGGARAA